MGRIYKRGRTWYGDWLDSAGQRHRESLQTADRQVALERLRQCELRATDPAAHSTETVDQALAYLLRVAMADSPPATVKSYEHKAGHLVRVLGSATPLRALSRALLADYVAQRRDEGAHPHSLHKEIVVLRRALTEARDRDRFAGDLERLLPRVSAGYRPRERWLTHAEYRRLLSALPERRRLWLVVACNTGARLSELQRLAWEDIDTERGRIRLDGRKTKRSRRTVPIPAELAAWLWCVPDERRTGRVLEPWQNYRRDLRAACKRAGKPDGIPAVSANDLRRTYASWLLQAGVDPFTVSRLLGHGSTQMVERVYGQLSDERFAAAGDALSGCAVFVPHGWPLLGTLGSSWHNGAVPEKDESAGDASAFGVPRDRVELPTRGFSGRVFLQSIRGGKR